MRWTKARRLEQIYAATRQLHAHGVQVAFFLQFGYPGETRADIEAHAGAWCATCCRTTSASVVSYPLPGTPFYERVRHKLGERANWVDSEDLAMLYRGPFGTAFYRQLHTIVHKDYRSIRRGSKSGPGNASRRAGWGRCSTTA